jgi:N-sulfoglucosamine sulfohydrolase
MKNSSNKLKAYSIDIRKLFYRLNKNIKLVSIFVCCILFFDSIVAQENNAPNVLLITADDMSWNSLGCTGNNLENISPNLDKLATQGILIENLHIATPICGPSRHALYTGQYPQRSGFMGHGVQPPQWWKAENRIISKNSITTSLTKKGYLTGVVGKHGSDWCEFSESTASQSEGSGRRTNINSERGTGMGRNPAKYYAFVREFLSNAKKEGKPFYLAANAHDPHRYWARHNDETTQWINMMMASSSWDLLENGKPYPDPKTQFNPADCPMPAPYPDDMRLKVELSKYYDSVNRMDEVVGEVLRALEESGMADNTIVIFLSDHGLAWDMSKWSLYPSGTKTPLIIKWPDKIKSGQIDKKSVLSVVDIAPTIADMCELAPLEKIDGMSFLSLLNGDTSNWKRKEAYSFFNYLNNEKEYDKTIKTYSPDLYKKISEYRPSRSLSNTQFTYIWNGWADGSSKVAHTMGGELRGLMLGIADNAEDKSYPDYRERVHFMEYRTPEELYDIVKDPGCLNNLAKNKEYQQMINEFRTKMENMLKNTYDQELENYVGFTTNK